MTGQTLDQTVYDQLLFETASDFAKIARCLEFAYEKVQSSIKTLEGMGKEYHAAKYKGE